MHITPTPTADAAIDLTRDWHDTDDARALIAAVVAAPVVMDHSKAYVQNTDRWHTYEGNAADQLRLIYGRYGDAVLRAHEAAHALFVERYGREPYDLEYVELARPLHRWCRQRVDDLIDGLLVREAA